MLEKIGNVVQRSAGMQESITKYGDKCGGQEALRARVFNPNGVPFIGPVNLSWNTYFLFSV